MKLPLLRFIWGLAPDCVWVHPHPPTIPLHRRSITMSLSRFVHLDDYQSPIQTDIARPTLLLSHQPGSSRVGSPAVECWPPLTVPWDYWARISTFAEHCEWMCNNIPTEYVITYWMKSHRLPALGHLHILYHPPDECAASGEVLCKRASRVDLPPDLCICDCVLPPTLMPPVCSSSETPPVVKLLSLCVRLAFHWVLFSATEVLARMAPLPQNMLILAHLYCSVECSLPGNVQETYTVELWSSTTFLMQMLLQISYIPSSRTVIPFVVECGCLHGESTMTLRHCHCRYPSCPGNFVECLILLWWSSGPPSITHKVHWLPTWMMQSSQSYMDRFHWKSH